MSNMSSHAEPTVIDPMTDVDRSIDTARAAGRAEKAAFENRKLEKRLVRQTAQAISDYGMIGDGDRVMVCLSGGKDSYTMLHLLERVVRSLPFRVELVAVHLDQRQPGYDGTPLVRWLERRSVRFEILSEDTYSTVKERLDAGQTPCATCSRLTRGILYSASSGSVSIRPGSTCRRANERPTPSSMKCCDHGCGVCFARSSQARKAVWRATATLAGASCGSSTSAP